MCVCVCVCVSCVSRACMRPCVCPHHAKLPQFKNRKHAIPYEQANHAFLSPRPTVDTYGKLSDGFVRFLWMLANYASTNHSRLSQPSHDPKAPPIRRLTLLPHELGSSFSRIRLQVGSAIAKAAVACFVPDSSDYRLPLLVFWNKNKPTASKPSTTYC